jgi:two-component system sensor histidine kinase DesK
MLPHDAAPADAAATRLRHDLRLARSISVTWWYTVSGVLFLEATLVLIAVAVLAGSAAGSSVLAVVGLGGIVWWGATCVLLLRYRRRRDDTRTLADWRTVGLPLLLCAGYGITAGLLSGLWVIGGFAVVQPLLLLAWPRGVRLRLVIASTVLLIALWLLDQRSTLRVVTDAEPSAWWMFGFFAISLPVLSVLTLWWWDVLVTLDEARSAAGRLAATQERLRVATDVHDLQGHHLQVIALQLELAERLMEKDPAAAMEQLRRARESVDDARQGTRDLAAQFRAVSLRDEIANAVDLLRAAGAAADASVDEASHLAPASVLGPVIRETTTNVLRHGGGKRVRLALSRADGAWRYEIVNDQGTATGAMTDAITETMPGSQGKAGGSGLEGIARRVEDAGGIVDVRREPHQFTLVVTVPDGSR